MQKLFLDCFKRVTENLNMCKAFHSLTCMTSKLYVGHRIQIALKLNRYKVAGNYCNFTIIKKHMHFFKYILTSDQRGRKPYDCRANINGGNEQKQMTRKQN